MKKTLIILLSLLISGCNEMNVSSSSSFPNQDVQIPVSSNTIEYTLTFKFADLLSNDKLIEVDETERFTYTYTFTKDYIINEEDYEKIYSDVNKEIPINNGGYYTFSGFYDDLDMNKNLNFNIGFKVDNNYTFYYTMIGGLAPIPTGTYILNIIDENNYIFDKPKYNTFHPGEIIKLHSYPIMDADLAMYIDGEYYCIQTSIIIEDEYIWEYIFEMPNKEITISFKIEGGI